MSSSMMQQEPHQPEDSSGTTSATATATTTSTANAKKPPVPGIDIHKALDILNDRSASHHHDHDHDHDGRSSPAAAVGGCHVHQTEELKSMGQTIDLFSTDNNAESANDDNDKQKKEQEEARRKERAIQLQAELNSMTVKELLKTVLETQQQRVSTYQGYNESLTQVLQSANMTAYISSCANTTAAFAVLSDTVRAVRTVLVEQHNRHDLKQLLTTLQEHEKLKLNLTAALHLERIRERNENMNLADNANAANAIHKDQRISQLLRQGVESLQEKLQACVEDINEAVEEIRYAWVEEQDDDNGEE